MDESLWGATERSNPSYKSQRRAQLASELPRSLWYIRPEIATNEGLPGVGNERDDSNAAKENMRFNRRDRREIFGLLMMESYSAGKGGSGGIRANLFPFGPQQNPDLSPVSRITPQVLQACIAPRLFVIAPHWRFGEEIGLISHVRLREACNSIEMKQCTLEL